MYKLLIFINLVLFGARLFAQETDSIAAIQRNSFVLLTGYSRHVIRDAVISPFIYRGATIPLKLEYRHSGGKSRQRAFVYFDKNTSKSFNSRLSK